MLPSTFWQRYPGIRFEHGAGSPDRERLPTLVSVQISAAKFNLLECQCVCLVSAEQAKITISIRIAVNLNFVPVSPVLSFARGPFSPTILPLRFVYAVFARIPSSFLPFLHSVCRFVIQMTASE